MDLFTHSNIVFGQQKCQMIFDRPNVTNHCVVVVVIVKATDADSRKMIKIDFRKIIFEIF